MKMPFGPVLAPLAPCPPNRATVLPQSLVSHVIDLASYSVRFGFHRRCEVLRIIMRVQMQVERHHCSQALLLQSEYYCSRSIVAVGVDRPSEEPSYSGMRLETKLLIIFIPNS
jgi:hypothetical protein